MFGRACAAVAALALLCLACAPSSSTTSSSTTSSSTPSASTPSASKGAGFPFVIDRLSERFAGRVVEVVAVDGYVYVKVAVDGAVESAAPRWVVSLKKEILVDDRVDVAAFGSAEGFVSKKLGLRPLVVRGARPFVCGAWVMKVTTVLPVSFVVVGLLSGCELAQPFEGPGFSISGEVLTDAPGPFIAATTLLTLNEGSEAQTAFDGFSAAMNEELPTAPGLVGKSLAQGPDGYRTLSVWETEEDMLAWVVSEVHADAMSGMVDHTKGGATVSYTLTRDDLEAGAPSWDDAKARLDEDGKEAY